MNKQASYKLALEDKHLLPVIAYGSAGTGKTFGAVEAAHAWLCQDKSKKLIVTRPNESFAKTLGSLPGNEREKMEPWVAPVIQHLEKFATKAQIADWERRGQIVFKPLEHIQGLTFDNSFIILDEAQNCTIDQLRVFLTRIGKWSKVVLTGDIKQTSPYFRGSGLASLIHIVDKYNVPAHTIEFDKDDIVRSEQCKKFIEAFEIWEGVNGRG